MADYVDLRGVRTWYEVHGAGESLVLLHPGGVGVDSRVSGPNISELSEVFRVYTPDRRGHGARVRWTGPSPTVEMYEALARGELAVVPGASHGLFVEKPSLCNAILDFFRSPLVETLAPIRRRVTPV